MSPDDDKPTLVVHPADVPSLATIKALAALLDLNAIHSNLVPRGSAYLLPSVASQMARMRPPRLDGSNESSTRNYPLW